MAPRTRRSGAAPGVSVGPADSLSFVPQISGTPAPVLLVSRAAGIPASVSCDAPLLSPSPENDL